MCLAIPGQIIKIEGKKATIKYPQEERAAFLGDPDFKVGDYVLVQMGVASRKITEKEAKASFSAWSKN